MENPESRDMRMVGEGEPGFPTCLLLLRINKRLEKVYRCTPEYAYYQKKPEDTSHLMVNLLFVPLDQGLLILQGNVQYEDFV
jgi:hypothetical protein